MSGRTRQYWGFRVDTRPQQLDFLGKEFKMGRLRQGWGWLEKQDLRLLHAGKPEFVDNGAGKNYPIFSKVKKDDIVLVPRLPAWHEVAIAKATDDWDLGYQYQYNPDSETGDHAHVFPVEPLCSFVRGSGVVDGGIRTTLRCPGRFWNMTQYAESIEKIRRATYEELDGTYTPVERLSTVIEQAFSSVRLAFHKEVSEKAQERLESKDWEVVYAAMIRRLHPHCMVEIVQGKGEKEHGTDVLITVPGPFGNYGIAVQIKDYAGHVDKDEIVNQINKAEPYWEGRFLDLQKIVLLVGVNKKSGNLEQSEIYSDVYKGVTFQYRGYLDSLLSDYAVEHVGDLSDRVDQGTDRS